MLLSGSVIGGVNDLGAVYYNPGRLSQIKNPAFLISADVYEMEQIKVGDAFGDNLNISKREIKGVPSLAAGTFSIPWLKGHHFGWAILVRQNVDMSFRYKDEVYDDVIAIWPGNEYFGAVIDITNKGNEQWTGLNWSYSLTENLSVGFSGFLSLYTQLKGNAVELQALTDSNSVPIYHFNKKIGLEQYNLIGKFGLSYKTPKLIFGFTLLAPSIRLKGSGSYTFEEFYGGIPDYGNATDIYTSSYQSGLLSGYKTRGAVGAGISWLVGKSTLHLSAEWYNRIPKYTIMQAEDHYSQSHPDSLYQFSLVDDLTHVINAGIGVEFYISEKVNGYLSASTDFSAVTSDISKFIQKGAETTNSISKADFYHFGGGVVLKLRSADITLGATYTGAKQSFIRPVSFPDDKGDEVFGDDDTATLEWDRVRVVFSFSLPFLKDVQEKVEEKFGF
jgi:hypothetical protein